MNTLKIERIGYFDRVLLDGSLRALKGTTGITIKANETLIEAIDKDFVESGHDIARLRVELLGESIESQDKEETLLIKTDRFNNGIKMVAKHKEIERYLTAYMEISIIKGNYAFPYRKEIQDIEEYCQKLDLPTDEIDNYLASMHLALEISKLINEGADSINIAIIDKVYVQPSFRKCGISSWLHSNAVDIINVFAMTYVHGIVLTYGDFTNQSSKITNYTTLLKEHYIRQGYIGVINETKKKWGLSTDNVMYKIML